ncbi:putative Zn-dependent peptidase [Streptoalloteichus tenebrarius]|uniref:Zn-dependent peptidase n=1 Tax=Streptoalloteichus tenebrarius (strain ATCC 17920 / DSM 40477 / JCM 4838 / CBS 697.72 / NBRC 16177 / NCIMB 11028 / NRRL B-12390 / A12253. 1 / ISP 5477) TaxID=1933 RepID=A0ABT1HN13_STRSD|nr:pitrilysin family protein [Streptoalloteichus tenebrarius]MCP2256911.1 putative Zn-dependent peptidase [Streptoalloteichus tenebrarius]BFF00181.1 pitrilysin family protein [Streptoalloteichus tenebrarius]
MAVTGSRTRTTGGRPGHQQRPGSTRVLERAEGGGVRRSVLPGGLRVITERIPGVRSASVGVWVGVGSRDETPSVAGAAHYLEHLLFKGTARRSAVQIAEEMDAVGGELNAFTAKEHTCYYAHVLDSDLPLAVDLLTDVVFDAVCAPQDMETERGVVLEEIAMRDDDPEDLLHDAFCTALLGDHPLGRPVLGSEESISAMSRDALYRFYRRRYALPTMVVAAAGNLEHAQVLRLVRAALGDRLAGDAAPAPPRRGRARVVGARRLSLHTDDTEQAHLMLGVRSLDRHDERRFALGVLNAALGGGMSSRLFQEVRERRGLAYSVYSSVASYADTGSLAVYAGCQPERLGDVAGVVRAVLAEVAAHGLSEAEVARGRGQLRGGLVLGLEDTGSRMSRIGKGELNYADHLTVEQTLERIDAVTSEQVAELARELLRRPLSAAVVGPYAHPDDLPAEVHEVMR